MSSSPFPGSEEDDFQSIQKPNHNSHQNVFNTERKKSAKTKGCPNQDFKLFEDLDPVPKRSYSRPSTRKRKENVLRQSKNKIPIRSSIVPAHKTKNRQMRKASPMPSRSLGTRTTLKRMSSIEKNRTEGYTESSSSDALDTDTTNTSASTGQESIEILRKHKMSPVAMVALSPVHLLPHAHRGWTEYHEAPASVEELSGDEVLLTRSLSTTLAPRGRCNSTTVDSASNHNIVAVDLPLLSPIADVEEEMMQSSMDDLAGLQPIHLQQSHETTPQHPPTRRSTRAPFKDKACSRSKRLSQQPTKSSTRLIYSDVEPSDSHVLPSIRVQEDCLTSDCVMPEAHKLSNKDGMLVRPQPHIQFASTPNSKFANFSSMFYFEASSIKKGNSSELNMEESRYVNSQEIVPEYSDIVVEKQRKQPSDYPVCVIVAMDD